MPVLAVGGEKSFGATEAIVMRNVAVNVREAVVPGAGHWLMEESPKFTVALIRDFLKDQTSVAE
jgi:pimeloyl-ACP methyl ester carboxylesterase